jgi:hypothetical protein
MRRRKKSKKKIKKEIKKGKEKKPSPPSTSSQIRANFPPSFPFFLALPLVFLDERKKIPWVEERMTF